MIRFRTTILTLLTALWLLVGCQTAPAQPPVEASPTPVEEVASAPQEATPTRTRVPASATEAVDEATPTKEASPTEEASPTRASTRTPRPTRTATATEAATATIEASPTLSPTVAPPTETPVPATETPAPATPTAPPPTEAPPVVQAPASASQPMRLQIPKIGVDAVVESVGLTSAGLMDVPQGVMNAAWYNLGATPGQPGNAVFSGHLDDYKQDPAVFWRLDELEVGDEVVSVDATGRTYRYQVTGKELYPYDQAPLERIFGYSMNAQLNLITCNGVWDQANRNYDQRLVVYTELIR